MKTLKEKHEAFMKEMRSKVRPPETKQESVKIDDDEMEELKRKFDELFGPVD